MRLLAWLLAGIAVVALSWWLPAPHTVLQHALHFGLTLAFMAAIWLVERPARLLSARSA
jgi:hypothetical protein